MTANAGVFGGRANNLSRPLSRGLGVGLIAVALVVSGCARRTTTTTTTTFPAPAAAASQQTPIATQPAQTEPKLTRAERRAQRKAASSGSGTSLASNVGSTAANVGSTAADVTGAAARSSASGGGSARSSLVIPAGLIAAGAGIAAVEQQEEDDVAIAALPPGVPAENLRIGEDRCYYYLIPDQPGRLGRVTGADGSQICL